jgi:hypothetical protein
MRRHDLPGKEELRRRSAVRRRATSAVESGAEDLLRATVISRLRASESPAPESLQRAIVPLLQRTLGNDGASRLLSRADGSSVSGTPQRAGVIQRDPPPTKDPSLEEPKKPADLAESGKDLLLKYAEKYLGKLSDEAKKKLMAMWETSPTGVISAGAVIGGAGIAYLISSKTDVPGIPEIPLDILGGPFKGASIKLEIKGPLTDPESFGFKLTFKEQGRQKPKRRTAGSALNIYDYANPEAIAREVDGPEFETEIPDAGPDSNIRGENLANLVRVIGNGMLAGVQSNDKRPYVDLGVLPPTPEGFAGGLKKIVDALVQAAPTTLGSLEQVTFRFYRMGKQRLIPIVVVKPTLE